MLNASVREYELLKKEVQSIKECITKYIGYIIGSNGIAYLIFGSLKNNTPNESPRSALIPNVEDLLSGDIVLAVEIIIVLSIYYVINYKFASHNRYIGYMQLLSQEIIHSKYENQKPISGSNLDDGYLPNNEESPSKPKKIFSWEYVNSKWNNRTNPKEYPDSYFNKLDLRLQLPSDYSSFQLNLQGQTENAIQLFFRNIIWKGFRVKRWWKFYDKFVITSWKYPRYMFILTSLLLYFSLFLLLMFSNLHLYILGAFSLFVVVLWMYFLIDLYRLLKRDKTIDYYCWAFLSYRTMLLNNYSIRPIYHSTSFHRYFKSLKMAEFIQSIKDSANKRTWIEGQIGSVKIPVYDNVISKIIKGWRLSEKERAYVKWIKKNKSDIEQCV